MKYSLLLFVCIIVITTLHAQNDGKIVLGKKDSVYSEILKEKREVWIYTPYPSDAPAPKSKRYPVIYLLDGDGHFESVVGIVQQLSQVNGNSVLPEMIIVAIPNTDRTRDLTPTHIDADPPMMDSNFSRNTGGGEKFTAFMEKELMPHIDSALPTRPFKVLIGHSFGGLTVMNILTNHANLFNAYIAIDPSMWYDKNRFLKTTQTKLSAQKFDNRTLYLGIANTMSKEMTLEKMYKDTTSATRHIRSIFTLDRFIKSKPGIGLRYASKYYPNDDHSSSPLITEYDGLRFIFNWYKIDLGITDYLDSTAPLAKKMTTHYKNVSSKFGYEVLPSEEEVNGWGYMMLGQKQFKKAGDLFELNMANYPESGNTYDSYADFLVSKKDTAAALKFYQKAMSKGFSEETQQKINRLQGKSTFSPTTKDLEKYVGAFEFTTITLSATTFVKGNALWVNASGYGDFELEPVSPHVFKVKGMEGQKIEFEMQDGKVIGMINTQPNGTFKAQVKK